MLWAWMYVQQPGCRGLSICMCSSVLCVLVCACGRACVRSRVVLISVMHARQTHARTMHARTMRRRHARAIPTRQTHTGCTLGLSPLPTPPMPTPPMPINLLLPLLCSPTPPMLCTRLLHTSMTMPPTLPRVRRPGVEICFEGFTELEQIIVNII